MPREKIPDHDTPGLYVQVNWSRLDEDEPATPPGHVQISTHDERTDARVFELLESARLIITRGGDIPSEHVTWLVAEWQWRLDNFRAELTGSYVTLHPDTQRHLIRTLHRAGNQAWPEPHVTGVLDGVRIPRAGEQVAPGELPPPGATGYPVARPLGPA